MLAAAPAGLADLAGVPEEEDTLVQLSPRCGGRLEALPTGMLELLLHAGSLRDASRAACACVALRSAARAAATSVTVLSAATLGMAQPSIAAVAFAVAHCPRLRAAHLGADATDAHLLALLGCVLHLTD
jgi:hypothetical protein